MIRRLTRLQGDLSSYVFFFFQAEDGIRDYKVTGVQTLLFRSPLTSLAQGVEAARVQETVATARFKKAAPYRVGVAAGYLSNSWVVFCLQHIRYEAARHKEISEVLVTDAGFNPGKQVADIEDLISKNVNLILYWPIDEKAIQPALEKAVVKGIPTVNTG